MRKSVAAALAAASIVGGSIGIASAQDSGSTPAAPAAPGTKFQSNEDPAHEANETAEQEAAEDAGLRPQGGRFRGGSNEDPAHEAQESPEREAQEHAGGAGRRGPAAPATSSGSNSSGASF